MPLVPPNKLREKLLLIAAAKAGKTTCHLSIAWWSWKSGGTARFFVIDTEDAVRAVCAEPKYDGILAEDGGPIHIFNVFDWLDYQEASDKIVAEAKEGDWIVIDMVTHAWPEVQQHYLREATGATSRGQALLSAAKGGARGWDLYRDADIEWPVVNGLYDDWLKPMLLRSRAHVFMVAEQTELQEGGKTPADQKEHLRDFGKFKATGQKGLPYQCRSYLRLQRLARGRVLYTLGDRAREELQAAEMSPDFMTAYLKNVAGWTIESPEEAPAT